MKLRLIILASLLIAWPAQAEEPDPLEEWIEDQVEYLTSLGYSVCAEPSYVGTSQNNVKNLIEFTEEIGSNPAAKKPISTHLMAPGGQQIGKFNGVTLTYWPRHSC